MNPEKLIFIDETGTKTNMSRRYGRCPKGQRLVARVPHGHWKTNTFIAALRHTRLTAPMVLDGPIDGNSFRAWVQQCLVPTLTPGDVVVMDNLSVHKVSGIKEMIQHAGAQLLYLPPYSPDLNPIEMAFARLKAWLRKLAAHTTQELHLAIALAIENCSHNECINYFKASGYL
jgi:transposase